MSDLRQAAQQALERLEACVCPPSVHHDIINPLRAALKQQQAEPVAWMTQSGSPVKFNVAIEAQGKMYGWEALYTTPPQRKPLTDEQLEAMAEKYITNCYFDTLKYARAVEAAHGIRREHD